MSVYYKTLMQAGMELKHTINYGAFMDENRAREASEYANWTGIGLSTVQTCLGSYEIDRQGNYFVKESLPDQQGKIGPIQSGMVLKKEFYTSILTVLKIWAKNIGLSTTSSLTFPSTCHCVKAPDRKEVLGYYADAETANRAARFLSAFNGLLFPTETLRFDHTKPCPTKLSLDEQLRLLELSFPTSEEIITGF